MVPGRNDPCPCGSGRKYKHCCIAAEPTDVGGPRSTARFAGTLPRAIREAASKERIWQAEAVPLMIVIEEAGAGRPIATIVVAGEFVIHSDVGGRLAGGAEPVARTLERAIVEAARNVGNYPESVRVRHTEVAAALAPRLEARQVEVVALDPLPELEEAARGLMTTMAGGSVWPPVCRCVTWIAWDLPRPLIAELFAVAAVFFRHAPWKSVANLQAPRATLPSGREWTVCILGSAGQEFGLALYSDAVDLFDRTPEDVRDEPFAGVRGRIIAMSFEQATDLPEESAREARLGCWEVAGPAAFPTLMTVNSPGGGVTADDIRDLILLLWAMPPFIAAHRPALAREEQTGSPCEPIEWLHEDTGVVLRYAGEAMMYEEPEDEPVMPADMRRDLDALMQETVAALGPGADPSTVINELNVRLAARTRSYNQTPQPELGDLSPAQVQRLLSDNWTDPDGALRLRQNLSLAELGRSDLFFNARVLLTHVAELGPLGATPAGNLQIAAVQALLDKLRLDPNDIRALRSESKRITEQDAWVLHELRVLTGLAGLLRHRKKQFALTKDAVALLDDSRAGELYARLFVTCFRKFNLGYGTRLEWPELQHQAAFTLYRLTRAGSGWQAPAELLPGVVLPFALERAPRAAFIDAPSLALGLHLLRPLADFDLLERQPGKPAVPYDERYCPAPLLARFIRFAL